MKTYSGAPSVSWAENHKATMPRSAAAVALNHSERGGDALTSQSTAPDSITTAPAKKVVPATGNGDKLKADAKMAAIARNDATRTTARIMPPIGSDKRPQADLLARGRAALSWAPGSIARARALYATRRAACVC